MRARDVAAGRRAANRLLGALAVLGVLAAGPAFGIASIRVTPPQVFIDPNMPVDAVPVTLTWTVTAAPGPTRNIGSPAGSLVLQSGATRQTLQSFGPLGPQPATGGSAVFTETIQLDAASIDAAKRSTAQLLYVRTFEAQYTFTPPLGVPVPQNIVTRAEAAAFLRLGGPAAGALHVSRAFLAFDDGSVLRVVGPRAALRARAELTYAGRGTLVATWEVADPSSTAGNPVYVPLANVHCALGADQRLTLTSPPLPTVQNGLHRLRLSVQQPASLSAPPEIRYRVLPEGPGGSPDVIGVAWPPAGTTLLRDTSFRWQPTPGASAYRLELFDVAEVGEATAQAFGANEPLPPAPLGACTEQRLYERADASAALAAPRVIAETAPPTTGVLLPGKATEALLTAAALQHVRPGHRYLWQVAAFGSHGRLIAISEPRPLLVVDAP